MRTNFYSYACINMSLCINMCHASKCVSVSICVMHQYMSPLGVYNCWIRKIARLCSITAVSNAYWVGKDCLNLQDFRCFMDYRTIVSL